MTLTETQATILSNAAQHSDRIAAPPANLPPAPRVAVAKALIKTGLLEAAESLDEPQAGLAWKLDGEAVFLRITDAGLAALRTEPAPAAEAPQEALQAAPASIGAHRPAATPTASPAPLARATGLSDAACLVLAAWDNEAGEQAGLPEAIEALRAALPPARQPRQAVAPRTPRAGTKQEAVLALLRRPEGATVGQIAEATGWQPHTVRGFFAGLKKRGTDIAVLERVRQVGPNKAGAKGSYTVYRIAAAA
jgi:hypothetical protein